jgi:hypothetical protein
MDDQPDNEADAPIASGPDDLWWRTIGADVADKEKRAIAAQDFQQDRALRYVLSEGREDIGGWLQSGPCSGREIYRLRGRQIDWM